MIITECFFVYKSKDPDDLLIRAGEWDFNLEVEHIPHQDRHVLKVIKHEKYYGDSVLNDIALIILTNNFIMRENVGTICLPPQGYQFHSERCYVSGWGKDANSKYTKNTYYIF